MVSSNFSTLPSLTITAVAAAVVTVILATIPPSSAALFPYYHAHVINELDPAAVLLVRCHCTDHNLGDQHIEPGREFEWRFKEHVFRKALWQCYVSPEDNSRHVNFKAFDDFTLTFHNHVYWVVKETGVFYRDADSRKDQFKYGWENGRVPVS